MPVIVIDSKTGEVLQRIYRKSPPSKKEVPVAKKKRKKKAKKRGY